MAREKDAGNRGEAGPSFGNEERNVSIRAQLLPGRRGAPEERKKGSLRKRERARAETLYLEEYAACSYRTQQEKMG